MSKSIPDTVQHGLQFVSEVLSAHKKNVKLHIIVKLGHQCHISKFASWYLEQATDTLSLVLF